MAEIETPGPHAFISYVREDATLVDELERVLTAAGIPVWRDVRDLFPGDNWRARIRQAIQQGALAFGTAEGLVVTRGVWFQAAPAAV